LHRAATRHAGDLSTNSQTIPQKSPAKRPERTTKTPFAGGSLQNPLLSCVLPPDSLPCSRVGKPFLTIVNPLSGAPDPGGAPGNAGVNTQVIRWRYLAVTCCFHQGLKPSLDGKTSTIRHIFAARNRHSQLTERLSHKRESPPAAGLFLSKTWRPVPSDHRQDFPVRLPTSRESLAIQPVSGEMRLRPSPPGTGGLFCCGRRPCRPVHNHGSGGLPTLAVPRNGYFRLVKRGAGGIRPSRH